MKQRDLLSEIREILDDVDANLDDRDLLWSDNRIVNYFNRAQDKFCLHTGFIIDEESTELLITTAAATVGYALHQSIIQVLGVFDTANSVWLQKKSTSSTLQRDAFLPYFEPDETVAGQAATGYYLDKQTGKLKFEQTPDGIYTYQIKAWRRPISYLTSANENSEPEIPASYHHALISYAAWRCLMHFDADTLDPSVARSHKADWIDALSEGRQEYRQVHGLTTEFAVGMDGWTWPG